MARRHPQRARRTAAFAKALTHPLRVEILESFEGRANPRSPTEIADRLDEPLGNVSYHVKRLVEAGALALAGTEPRRGAVEHFYRLTPAGRRMLDVVREL